jgi:hypothetical protein
MELHMESLNQCTRKIKRLASLLITITPLIVLFTTCISPPDTSIQQVTPPVTPPVDSSQPSSGQRLPYTPPTIVNIQSDFTQVKPLGKVQLSCETKAVYWVTLIYNWTATDGTINGNGATVAWTAPQKGGDYKITAAVTDSNGGYATKDIVINVPDLPNHPPIITAIEATSRFYGPSKTLRIDMTKVVDTTTPEIALIISRLTDITLQCYANDSDGDILWYLWNSDCSPRTGVDYQEGVNEISVFRKDSGSCNVEVTITDKRGGITTAKFRLNITVQ